MRYWIRINRQYETKDLVVGPYLSKEAADHAMQHAILIEGFCQEDCLDCSLDPNKPSLQTDDVVLVDLNDPDHTGIGNQSNIDAELVILFPEVQKGDDNG